MLKIISKEKLSPWYAMTHSLRFKFHSVSQAAFIFKKLKVLLRSKFNVKFVTKTLSFQFIRSGCTCFGH